MSAYFDSGFSVRKPMWHGLGNVLNDYPTDWADARVKGGLTWEPKAVPAYVKLDEPRLVPMVKCGACGVSAGSVDESTKEWECVACGVRTAPELSLYVPVEEQKIIIRDDTSRPLGVVGTTFELVYHHEMGALIEAILGETNVKFETLISMKQGAQVCALVYLDEPVQIGGEDSPTLPFLALANAHDGSAALRALFTSIRVVCWNTYSAAIDGAERDKSLFTFRHTSKIKERIEEAKTALVQLRADHAEWVSIANALYALPVNEDQVKDFTTLFLPEPPAGTFSDRVKNNIDRDRATFDRLYSEAITTEGHRGTALGLVDAAVEYLDHVRGYRNADTYLGRTLLRPEPLKAKAVSIVRELCGVGGVN